MADSSRKSGLQGQSKGWLVILPTLIIAALVLVATESTSAAPLSAPSVRVLRQELTQTPETPLCQTCHPAEYDVWKDSMHAKAALDPVFQEQLSKSRNQESCLACHTTGFDTGSGEFMAQGVTCEACHGTYKEGHPRAETMALPIASDTCRMCHQGAFAQWETSAHGEQGVECFDCHLAHTQGLRTGSEELLCAGCHADRQTEFAHATHGINGLDCKSCHMVDEVHDQGMPADTGIEVSNHSFEVGAGVCAGCHQDTIHTSDKLPQLRESAAQQDPEQLRAQAAAVPELEKQINTLQDSLVRQRNASIIGLGLALGVGGFIGLLLGLATVALLKSKGES